MKKIFAIALALCMVFALCACGQQAAPAPAPAAEAPAAEAPAAEAPAAEAPAAAGPMKVAFLTQSLENASQAFAWSQWQKIAPEYGFEVSLIQEDYDPQKGVAGIATDVADGYVAIACNPTDPAALANAFKEARDAGVIMSMYSNEFPDELKSERDFMCGTNDYLFGQIAAQTMMEALPDGAKIVEVGGQSGHDAQIKRHDGFFDTIAGNDKYEVLDTQDCEQWSSDDAQAIMENFIVKYGDDIDVIYCHWDVGLTGCIKALTDAGKDPTQYYTIGVDGCAVGFEQVKEGTQKLCIGQSFTQMTIDTCEQITKLLNGEQIEDVVWTEPQVVTIDTIDDYAWPEW